MARLGFRIRPSRSLTPALLVAATLAGLAGCRQPLFSDRYARSQYDRYDRARNQFAPAYTEDEFGRQKPNLRGRLEPK